MTKILKLLSTFLCLFLFVNFVSAQNVDIANIDFSKIEVSKLSNQQVGRIVKELEKNGLTAEQAGMMAKARGASQAQVDEMIAKINNYKMSNKTPAKSVKDKPVGAKGALGGLSLSADDMGESTVLNLTEKKSFIETPEMKKIFGFRFFNSDKLEFEPNLDIPVSDDYSMGIGDQILITVFGAAEQYYELPVEKNGCITIPSVGMIKVYGLSYKNARIRIKNRLKSIYGGMIGNQPNTFVDVSLGALKGIKVNVIGEVNMPGSYTLPSTASVFHALYLSGGPNEKGSFRCIDVIRGGKKIAEVDVYAYLIDGVSKNNIQLRNDDIILISPYKKRIIIEGELKRVGYFEAKDDESLVDMIRYSGGFNSEAYTNRIVVYRNNSRNRIIKDVLSKDFAQFIMSSGDKILVSKIIDRFSNKVNIEGAVFRPGSYELNESMKLSELINKAEGVKEDAFMQRAVITRLRADRTLESISFNVADIVNGNHDIELKKDDSVLIRSIFDIREKRTVSIFGELNSPGMFDFSENLNLGDLIFKAGGFKENAEVSMIEVSRVLSYEEISKASEAISHTFQFNLDRNLSLDKAGKEFKLKPFDRVYVRRAPGYRPYSMVHVSGEVLYAGDYSLSVKNERLSDVLKRAGGLTKEANIKGVYVRRKILMNDAEYDAKLKLSENQKGTSAVASKEIYQNIGIDLDKVLKKPYGEHDLILSNGDQIIVPSFLQTVRVSGMVLSPVGHLYSKKNVKYYIQKSGGFAPRAKKAKVYVLYANGTTKATKRNILWRKYPKVEPGCEIVIPKKPDVDAASQASRWLAIASTFASMVTAIALATK
ncbi:MAG: SLBB domain-containing protein [Marinifilaceae bacterium]|jgi:protein involved in polysaccharide export with SLBB domain|nr:SLBB domain-containing protein [Marinifilaceae bacterium]